MLYLNARTYLLDDLLPKMDRMTMAHGLEARSPLLDRDLMEYVAQLPDDFKRRGGRSKIVFKKAVEDLLPPEILRRPKHGFGVPLGDWFRGELRPMAEDTLLAAPAAGEVAAARRPRDAAARARARRRRPRPPALDAADPGAVAAQAPSRREPRSC